MKKIININLGGYPFTIDDDAYGKLDHYLKAIHNHFDKSEGYEEITSDIEGRLAELFQESLDGRPIVTMNEVNSAIERMGTPEDFGATSFEDDMVDTSSHTREKIKFKTGKRLFRDKDDEVIGGVCSGVAAYFGVEDPVWIRLGMVVLVLSSVGFIIPLYFILWAILPVAETSADRLAMRGEPINVSNIAKIVEEEVTNLSDKISEMGNDFSSKKKVMVERREEEIPLRKGFHC